MGSTFKLETLMQPLPNDLTSDGDNLLPTYIPLFEKLPTERPQ